MLQGSLDNFTLDEVLNLLAGTHKSGHLRISGDRGTGSLWVEEGLLVQAEASNVTTSGDWEDVMFELLRFESGNFSFVGDDVAPSPEEPVEIEPLVERGNELLAEWQSIEAVIKSPDHFLTVNRKLPSDQVMLTAKEWETLVIIGEGRTVFKTYGSLGIGELEGCRRIKSVIERGLVGLGDPIVRMDDTDHDDDALAEASVDVPPARSALSEESITAGFLTGGSPEALPAAKNLSLPSNVVPMPAFGSEPTPSAPSVPAALVPPTPPPAPPSPEEIRQFGESFDDASLMSSLSASAPPPPPPPPADFDPKVNEDGSAAADDEASLLMKYLQSET